MQLLDYVTTALLFSDKNVDSNLVTWNRVVLLHGERFGFVWQNKIAWSQAFLPAFALRRVTAPPSQWGQERRPLWSQAWACSVRVGYLTLHRAATWSSLVTFYAVIQLSQYLPCFPTGYGFLRIAVALYFFTVSLELLLMGKKPQKPTLHRTLSSSRKRILGVVLLLLLSQERKRIERKPKL